MTVFVFEQEIKTASLRRRFVLTIDTSLPLCSPSSKHEAQSLAHRMRLEIDLCLKRQDDKVLYDIFHRHEHHLSRGFKEEDEGSFKESLKAALEEINTKVHSDTLENIFMNIDLNDDGYLDFDQFKLAVREPTAMEQWTSSLPLNNLVAAALSPLIDLNPPFLESDSLRALSLCSEDQLRFACEAIMEGISKVLSRRLQELKTSYDAMDNKKMLVKEGIEQSKFVGVGTMNCGDIPSFFDGLAKIVGAYKPAKRAIWSSRCSCL